MRMFGRLAGVGGALRPAPAAPRSAARGDGLLLRALVIAVASAALLWLVTLYGNGLRDARYFDGWALTAGMSAQLYFHIAVKTSRMAPASTARWREIHIVLGLALVAAFLSHTDVSWPDTAFEWALWIGFVLITLTGIFGAALSRSRARRTRDELPTTAHIAARRVELAREVHAIAAGGGRTASIALLEPPHDAWIMDLYANRLRAYFARPTGALAVLLGSRHALRQLTHEIDDLSRYVDASGHEKLAAIKALVAERSALDAAHLDLALAKTWLYVHVPVTYALVVLTLLHVIVAYSFSAGAG